MDRMAKSKILIIDDDKTNLMYLNNLLSAEFTLYMAKDGAQSIRRAEEYHPDLILLDIVMPGMNGYEVMAEMRKSERTKDIPIIFISGLSSDDDEIKGLHLGADDYISKPFNDDIVLLRIRNQLKIINQMRLIIEKEIIEKSIRAKAEFLSRMSHELKTPMNAIIGMTALARNTGDNTEKNRYLDRSAAASRDMMRLVDDLLDLADLSENCFELNRTSFSFDFMLRETIRRSEQLRNEKNQTLSLDIDPAIPELLIGDETRLAQVIGNILSNAGKFTQNHGSIRLTAYMKSIENNDVTIQIDITDNGAGIAEEDQAVIFSAFEQVDGGIDRKHGGAGAGLPVSKMIIEKMGGTIWVESSSGRGSTFSLIFNMQHVKSVERSETIAALSGKTVLLADDIEINREIVIALLEETQLEFICAENGREAVEVYTVDPLRIDLILMDINMPVMDGVEATRRIRALGTPESGRVPIIAVTANTSPEDVKNYLAAGMTDHLSKPVEYEDIIHKITAHTFHSSREQLAPLAPHTSHSSRELHTPHMPHIPHASHVSCELQAPPAPHASQRSI